MEEVGAVVRGKPEVVRLAFVALLARGHLLLEDVPGVGKTTLARALAQSIGGSFSRIQLTADLLPADLIGGVQLDREGGGLSFRPGPVFSNVVIADELNRATPRTQSGLLEAMAERAVSVDGQTHALPSPFFVVATQNPVEHHGVYALPQSQLDRFLLRTAIGYPEASIEQGLITAGEDKQAPEALSARFSPESIEGLQASVDSVHISAPVAEYLYSVVAATRAAPELEAGVSTRGALSYAQACRARALLSGRDFVSPEDVFELAVPVCAHRVLPKDGERPRRAELDALLSRLRDALPVPA